MEDKIELRRKPARGDLTLVINGVQVYPDYSQKVRNHSQDGFQCGYGGSGPAQAALAILLFKADRELALRHYQAFKWEFVARWKPDTIYKLDVMGWVNTQEQKG